MKFLNSTSVAKSPQLLKFLLLSSAVATGTFLVLPVSSVLAAPITCGAIYGSYGAASPFNSLRTYNPGDIAPSNQIQVLNDPGSPLTSPNITAIAVDPILDTNGRRRVYYAENVGTAPTRIFYYDGVNTVNTGRTLAGTGFNRMGFAPDGTLYISALTVLYQFNPDRSGTGGTVGTAITISDNANNSVNISASTGGDIAFDNQGRMYILTYDDVTAPTEFRLFQIRNPGSSTPTAVLLGRVATTQQAAGLAFRSSDNLLYLQGTGGKSFSWDLGTNTVSNLADTTPGSGDLGSCTYPNLDPVTKVEKTVTNITSPGATALAAGNILEYTISISNTGNLAVGNATLLDLIPSGSTYVAGSTKLNGTAVTDRAGGLAPYANTTPKLINSPGQAAGVLTAGATNKATVVFRVSVTTANKKVCNQATFRYDGGSINGVFSDDASTTDAGDPTCIGTVPVPATPPVAITCGSIYGSYGAASPFGSLRTYVPSPASVSSQIAVLNDGAVTPGTPFIAAIAVDPILDTNGRRRIYSAENVSGTTRIFYYDGVNTVNTGRTLASGGFNRMGFAPDGTLYINALTTLYKYIPDRSTATGATTGILTGPLTISDNVNNSPTFSSSGGGDIAFDLQGRMYLVTYDATPTEFRLFQVLNPGSSNPTAVLLGKLATSQQVAGLAFQASDNKLYLQGTAGQSFSWDLATNTIATLTSTSPGSADLGSCSYPNLNPTNGIQKTVANITNPTATVLAANDILRYTISVSNTGTLAAGNATLVDLIPSGSTYVANSTKLNDVAVPDVSGAMAYANSSTPKLINSPGQAAGVLISGADKKATVVFEVKVNAATTKVCNQATFRYDGGPINGLLSDDPISTVAGDGTCIGRVGTNAKVSILKRIVAINGLAVNPIDNTNLAQFDNSNPNWPTNYIKGAVNGGKVKPGDTIEYAIYFLNDGDNNAKNVRICDRINPNQTYQTNLGMKLQIGATTNPVTTLTSINDPTIDRSQFIDALGAVPSDCNLPGANDNGTTVLDVTGTTGNPSLTTLPDNTYGVWRFTTKVNISP